MTYCNRTKENEHNNYLQFAQTTNKTYYFHLNLNINDSTSYKNWAFVHFGPRKLKQMKAILRRHSLDQISKREKPGLVYVRSLSNNSAIINYDIILVRWLNIIQSDDFKLLGGRVKLYWHNSIFNFKQKIYNLTHGHLYQVQ